MQHDAAASAPRTPLKASSFWVFASPIRPASDCARPIPVPPWFIMTVVLHPVAATGSRENFDGRRRTACELLDRRTVPPHRGQYRDRPILRAHPDPAG